ncbi:MAG: hypothetical protein ACLVFS_06745, partial [Butyricicoccus sp.]
MGSPCLLFFIQLKFITADRVCQIKLRIEAGEVKMNVEIKTYHKEMKPSRSFSIFHSQFSIIFWVLD